MEYGKKLEFRRKEEDEYWKEFFEESRGKVSYQPMIGIEFKLKIGYEKNIIRYIKNINFNNYQWEIVQEEIIYESNPERRLPSQLSGRKLKKEISDYGNYYIYFLNLQVYPINSKISHIETFDDFLNSDCELIVLFSDNDFIEIYMKRNELEEKVILNIVTMGILYDIKTVENDGRSVMIV